jgi:hypothetical protein
VRRSQRPRQAASPNEQAADQAGSRSGSSAEPGIPADSSKYRANPGTGGRAGNRALLGWGHVGAGDDRQSKGSKYQNLFHEILPE